ncbi:uncharacterized protein TNCV_1582761 [Trichonephila clavipes]|nr:uncharacterized protein TNCV_1582761 [Trichonephila clavipes]
MDVCKCMVPARHGGTLNSHRAASPLVKLGEGERSGRPLTTRRAKSDVKDCMGILNDIYETIQTEIKFVQNEIYEIAKAYPVDQGTTDFKSSDIVAVFRKLFSSFVEVRRNNVNSMKVELGLLQAKENSFSSEKELDESDLDSLKTEVFNLPFMALLNT